VYQTVLPRTVVELETRGGMHSGVFSVLAYLDASDTGELRFGRLHHTMRVRYSQPGLSRLVQRMERDGLVERRTDPEDGRGTVLVITRTGRNQLHRANAVYRAALEEHFTRHLGVDDARELTGLLEGLLERLQADDHGPETALPAAYWR